MVISILRIDQYPSLLIADQKYSAGRFMNYDAIDLRARIIKTKIIYVYSINSGMII